MDETYSDYPPSTYVNPIIVQRKAMEATRDITSLLMGLASDLVDVAEERDRNASAMRERNERGNLLAEAQQRISFLEEQVGRALISLTCVQPHDLETPEGRAEHIKLTRVWRDDILRALGWPTGDNWSFEKNHSEEED